MPSYIVGTSSANAKLIRNLDDSLSSLSTTVTVSCLTHVQACFKQRAFSTLTKETANQILPTIQNLILSEYQQVRVLSLRIITHISQAAPASSLHEHWLGLVQKVTQLIKSTSSTCNPNHHAQALSTIGALLSSTVISKRIGGSQKASVVTSCQSALVHAVRAISDEDSTAQVGIAAFAVVYAVLLVAPREIRGCLTKIENLIWNRWLNHPDRQVRHICAELFSHLIDCYADKVKQQAFEERIRNTCKQLDDIISIADEFTSFSNSRLEISNENLKSSSVSQLAQRFEVICSVLKNLVMSRYGMRMPFLTGLIIKVLVRGVGQREIDPYAKDIPNMQVNADTAIILLSTIFELCTKSLMVLAEACESSALLPYASVIGMSIGTRMTDMYLACESDCEITSSCGERKMLYQCLTVLCRILGMSIIVHTVNSFTRLLMFDIEHTKNILKYKRLCATNSTSEISDRRNVRKKRRRSNGQPNGSQPEEAETVSGSLRQMLDSPGMLMFEERKETMAAGFETCSAIFDNREFLTKSTERDLIKLEEVLLPIKNEPFISLGLLRATTSAAISGGGGRMKGETSSLFLPNAMLSTKLLTCTRSSGEARTLAFAGRYASETVIHPSGPPTWHSSRKYCTDENGARNVSMKKTVRFDLPEPSVNRQNDKQTVDPQEDTTMQDINLQTDEVSNDIESSDIGSHKKDASEKASSGNADCGVSNRNGNDDAPNSTCYGSSGELGSEDHSQDNNISRKQSEEAICKEQQNKTIVYGEPSNKCVSNQSNSQNKKSNETINAVEKDITIDNPVDTTEGVLTIPVVKQSTSHIEDQEVLEDEKELIASLHFE